VAPDESFVWAYCPGCGETWTEDTDRTLDALIERVADECRRHIATEHTSGRRVSTFGLGPLIEKGSSDVE
jgi:hypothetical protein